MFGKVNESYMVIEKTDVKKEDAAYAEQRPASADFMGADERFR